MYQRSLTTQPTIYLHNSIFDKKNSFLFQFSVKWVERKVIFSYFYDYSLFSFVFRQHVPHVKIYSIHQNNVDVDVILKCRTEYILEQKIYSCRLYAFRKYFQKFVYSKCETITDIGSIQFNLFFTNITNRIKLMLKI